MKSPLIISLFKISSSMLALVLAAVVKYLKEKHERSSRKRAMLKEMKMMPKTKNNIYKEPDEFMVKNYPETVSIKEELTINAFRPILILLVVSVFTYTSHLYLFYLVIVCVSFFMVEFFMEDLKHTGWFMILLVTLWILTFLLIWHEEILLQTPIIP